MLRFFRPHTYVEVLDRQYESARLELLDVEAQKDYYTNMAVYLQDKIARLEKIRQTPTPTTPPAPPRPTK